MLANEDGNETSVTVMTRVYGMEWTNALSDDEWIWLLDHIRRGVYGR